jgi:hypothetical protein
MELQPHAGGGKQGAGSHSELQPDGDGESKDSAPVCDESHPAIDYVVVNVDHLAEAIDDVATPGSTKSSPAQKMTMTAAWCARTPWSGWQSGGAATASCAASARCTSASSIYRNKRCCICRAYCFRVLVVTKAAAADAASSTTSVIPLLLWFAFWEGHVAGKYWYHRHSEAFFEDEEG